MVDNEPSETITQLNPKVLLQPTNKYHKNPLFSKMQNRSVDNFLIQYSLYFYQRLKALDLECELVRRTV